MARLTDNTTIAQSGTAMRPDARSKNRAGVTLEGIDKSFGDDAFAIRGLDLDVPQGSFVSMLGPSGCGKTTTLRMIAGLETPDAGRIQVAGRDVFSDAGRLNLAPSKRNLGFVFQSYALWPHMTVGENIEYPLKRAKQPSAVRKQRVSQVLDTLQCTALRDRYPAELSGGQQQRVALGRAIVNAEHSVILFDEPLSNLDARLREELRGELSGLQREIGFTAVYVTHDWIEAMSMSDLVVVMNAGRVVRRGTPEEVVDDPGTEHVARLLGFFNIMDATEVTKDGDGLVGSTALGKVRIATHDLPAGSSGTVAVPISNVEIGALGGEAAGVVATVLARTFQVDRWLLTLGLSDGSTVKGIISREAQVHVGDSVSCRIRGTVKALRSDDRA